MSRRVLVGLAVMAALMTFGCGQKGEQLSTTSQKALAEYKQGIEAADKLYFSEAAEHFGKAVELDAEFAVAYSRLSMALQNLGDEAKALQYQMKALGYMKGEDGKDRVTEKERLFIVLQDAYLHYDFAKAQQAIDRWTERYPHDSEALAFQGLEHLRTESYDEAILSFQKVVELNPKYVLAYNSLGYLYLAKGDFDKALQNLEKYKDMTPYQANSYDSMGELEQARGRYQEAIKHYQKALEINPDLRFVLHHLGEVHRIQGQYSRAIDYFLEAAEKAAGAEAEAGSRQYLAYSYLRRGNLKQALTEAMRAVELNPRDPGAHYNLGRVHVAMGDLETALADAEKVDEWLTKRNLKRYKADRILFHLMGQIYLAQKEYEIAIESYRRAVDLSPSSLYSGFYLHALGNAYYRAGKFEQAVSTLQIVLRQNPNDADCLYTLVLIYNDMGDKKQAQEMLDKFKEVFRNADEGVQWVQEARGMRL